MPQRPSHSPVRSLQHLCQLGHDLELSFVGAGEHDGLEVGVEGFEGDLNMGRCFLFRFPLLPGIGPTRARIRFRSVPERLEALRQR